MTEPSIAYLVQIAREDRCEIELADGEIRITGPTHDIWKGKLTPRAEELRRYLSGEAVDDADIPPDPYEIGHPVSVSRLIADYPMKREPIVDGLFRRGETCNIIGAPKAGKSWFIYGLLLSVASGRDWLGMPTTPGKVLLIDNEIHVEELSSRFAAVARAMAMPDDVLSDRVKVLSLRGRLQSIDRIAMQLDDAKPGEYSMIAVDAFYRCLPEGVSENDNAQMANVYNTVDHLAGTLDAAVVLNHHTSKGDQSLKGVTDVGSGAGSISRAADCHLIIRPHELESCGVLDGVCRSFPPVQPLTIGWEWPVWSVKDIEPALKRPKSNHQQNQEQRDQEGRDQIKALIADGPKSIGTVRKQLRCGLQRAERLVGLMEDAGELKVKTRRRKGTDKRVQVVELEPGF